jgi:RHS repeat-associated protein
MLGSLLRVDFCASWTRVAPLAAAGDALQWSYWSGGAVFGGRRHYHLDHLGSVRMVTDNQKRAVAEHSYYPFGVSQTYSFQEPRTPMSEVDTMRFAGHARDFVGTAGVETTDYLDYMHARYYDPNMGRFLSVDPSRLVVLQRPQTWNRYSYSFNNPINLNDPNGAWPTKKTLGIGGTVHQNAIDRALPFMERRWRAILKSQQIVADREQATALSYRHAMRAPEQTAAEARDLANAYVRNQLALAIKAQSEGSYVAAMEHLGLAIHTLQDETSPMHEGFQEWKGVRHVGAAKEHVEGENYDPGRGSELDAVTRKAWDWFVSGDVPRDVFQPNKRFVLSRLPAHSFRNYCSLNDEQSRY